MRSTANAIILALALAPVLSWGETPREPKGLKMQRTVDGEHQSVLIPWGATAAEVISLLPRTSPGAPDAASAVNCYGSSCTVSDVSIGGWRIDTGEVAFSHSPSLKLHQGKFYEYALLVPGDEFGDMFEILTGALGVPTESEDIPRQNAYGAEWIGRIRTWKSANSEVTLMAQLSRIDDGLLLVTYKPFAPEDPKPEGKAPF